MPTMTLEEIKTREADLRQKLADGRRLLAAYQVIRADWEKSLLTACDAVVVEEPAPPPVAVPAPQVNLEALRKGYGGGIRVVTWAIRQMSGDFTVHQIAAALRKADCPMRVAKISVVVNRMKKEHKITEITRGQGRTPSLFFSTDLIHARPLQLVARHRASRRHVLLRHGAL